MRTLARVLVGIAVLNVWRRCFRTHRTPSPVAPASTRSKVGVSHHPCAVCRERRATEGDVCDECDVWITALAYVNRDACERAS